MKSFEPIQRGLTDAVARLVGDEPLSAAKVELAWRVAVGAPLARATVVALGADGVLHVRAQGPIWRRELQRSKALILTRLEALLGKGAINRLEFLSN